MSLLYSGVEGKMLHRDTLQELRCKNFLENLLKVNQTVYLIEASAVYTSTEVPLYVQAQNTKECQF